MANSTRRCTGLSPSRTSGRALPTITPLGVRFGYLDAADDPDSWPVAGWLDEPQQLLSWLELPAMGRA